MDAPRTVADLEALITNRIEESLRLDYKESATFGKNVDATRKDLAKDVSAFANSDGGLIVYGMVEHDRLPTRLDGGVEHAAWPGERIENIISSNIAPRIPELAVIPICVTDERSYYVVRIGKSFAGPHQSLVEKRYFRRFNFKAEPMEDYEIRDVMNRREIVPPLISVDVDIRWGAIIDLVIRNIGDIAAEDVRFNIDPPVEKLANAKLLSEGTSFLPPGRTVRYFIASAHERISKDNALRFTVEVSYRNRRAATRVIDSFQFDLSDFLWTAIVDSDIERLGKKLEDSLRKLCEEIRRTNQHLATISTIAGGTGLDLSVRTLRNLRAVKQDTNLEFEQIRAHNLPARAFVEVLGVDFQTAVSLSHFATYGEGRLESVESLTPEIIARARAAFDFEEPDAEPPSSG